MGELVRRLNGGKRELTFRAPTGSGKTHMMGDLMNRVLGERADVVFLVSTLSKGNLAQQNFDSFKRCADAGVFPHLRPHLISTETSGEESLHIPLDYNVYVLPRDLFKKNGRLMQGAMLGFLHTMTADFFGRGMGRKIYLIKDECHQATNNLDSLSDDFFARIVNFSATPNLRRGQQPDVQISNEDAVRAKLIKRVEFIDDESKPVSIAVEKLVEDKERYRNLLGVNPCLIIQISNKDKAEEEWNEHIKPALDQHQELKWMKIMDKDKDCDTNDSIKKRLPVAKWKDYAKGNGSTIDVIVFKMVISEGWDIPRAYMLYQVRDTKSKQLDEQVVGRVRRNPRLIDFERLSDEAQRLATEAWVWGVEPESVKRTHGVTLWDVVDTNIRELVRVKTTRLTNLTQKAGFDPEALVKPRTSPTSTDIFTLYHRLMRCDNALQDVCYDYAGDDVARWWNFMEQIDSIRHAYDTYICDYAQSMEVDKETSFPLVSSYTDSPMKLYVDNWVWRKRSGKGTGFAFDSEAEHRWASLLQQLAAQCGAKMVKPDLFSRNELYLWGKNFPHNSDICYEYYADGIHASYPDFVMKDAQGRIHLFEVKSVNRAAGSMVSEEEYNRKVEKLAECYLHCSRLLPDHIFYLPILQGDDWHIRWFKDGEEDTMSEEAFFAFCESLRAEKTEK